jgi:hypothetical protein
VRPPDREPAQPHAHLRRSTRGGLPERRAGSAQRDAAAALRRLSALAGLIVAPLRAAALRCAGLAGDAELRLGRRSTLATTVGRESAAARAHNSAALRRQRAAAVALLPKLRGVLRSQASAGKALAGLLRSVHTRANLASAQVGQAFGIILADLARGHTNVGQVQRAASAALRPRAVDALALLGG